MVTYGLRGKFLFAVVMALMCAQAARAFAEDCASPPDRASIIGCVVNATTALETKLKLELSAIEATADAEHKALLEKSQSAWVRYRDAECEFEGDSYRGGTLQQDQPLACNLSEIKARLQELKSDIELSAH